MLQFVVVLYIETSIKQSTRQTIVHTAICLIWPQIILQVAINLLWVLVLLCSHNLNWNVWISLSLFVSVSHGFHVLHYMHLLVFCSITFIYIPWIFTQCPIEIRFWPANSIHIYLYICIGNGILFEHIGDKSL